MAPYAPADWRLIHTAPADGATQMALDEAVWQSVAAGRAPPTLRLYAWQPPCLSLGRNQSVRDADGDALGANGYDLVRRPTGGRAILHADELTYSVAVPLKDPRVEGDILASCQRLSQGLIEALMVLGMRGAALHRGGHGAPAESPVCFEAPADFEIIAGGRKLIGSAQMRGRGTLLQHGTLPLRGDIARICAFLTTPVDPGRVRSRAATLAQVLNRPVSWEEAARALEEGFARALNLCFRRGNPSRHEMEIAARLRRQKYGSEVWTARR